MAAGVFMNSAGCFCMFNEKEIKVKYLLSNYNRLPKLIESYESTLEIVVKAEKRYNAREELGDPGISFVNIFKSMIY